MKKKTLTIAIALVLVVALAVGATWAYLTAQSGPVVNTFTVGSVIAQGGFELKEHEVEYNNATGLYAFKDGMVETDRNTYDQLAPMTTAPKDPFVKFSKEIKSPAYLFVKVTDTTTGITADVDTTKWTELTGADLKLGANERLMPTKMSLPSVHTPIRTTSSRTIKSASLQLKRSVAASPLMAICVRLLVSTVLALHTWVASPPDSLATFPEQIP